MNSQSAGLVRQLVEVLSEDPPDVVVRGEEILACLFSGGDRGVVRALLPMFNDKGDHQELMWSMLHCIEALPGADYATELLAGARALWEASPEWSETLFLRAMRDPDTFAALSDQIPRMDATTRAALRPMLQWVHDQNPEDQEAAATLLARLEPAPWP